MRRIHNKKMGDYGHYKKLRFATVMLVWKMYDRIGVSKTELQEVTGLGRILIDRYIEEGREYESMQMREAQAKQRAQAVYRPRVSEVT